MYYLKSSRKEGVLACRNAARILRGNINVIHYSTAIPFTNVIAPCIYFQETWMLKPEKMSMRMLWSRRNKATPARSS